jgi:hypothetical protein
VRARHVLRDGEIWGVTVAGLIRRCAAEQAAQRAERCLADAPTEQFYAIPDYCIPQTAAGAATAPTPRAVPAASHRYALTGTSHG